ncbi:MAG: nitrite reductase small subunit NirD [Cytophagales bacterium]
MGAAVDTWVKVCKTDAVPENGGACAKVEGKEIAIFNFTLTNEWFATDNLCPHKQQMVLSRGIIGSQGEDCEPKVACPFHKKTFSLKSGECLSGDNYKISTYPIKVEDGFIFLKV